VDAGVYVPRAQTEELARRAGAALPPSGRAVDLCTGSGAVAAHLRHEVPTALVVGTDIDPAAAACARRNGVVAVVADLDPPLRAVGGVDVVTAVAPYVPTDELRLLPADVQRHEPRLALDGGDDGLHLARRVVTAAARLLRPGGSLLLEVGGHQDEALAPWLGESGFVEVGWWHDAEGDLRGVIARRAG
jgi:release factor glutamine methyltransferase